MSVRKIEYTVTAEGIAPAVKQFGGVQGEHRATEIVFKIDSVLYQKLESQAVNGAELIYRVDGYNAEGGKVPSDTAFLEGDEVRYMLEECITRYGGLVRAVLVISMKLNDTTEMELFSFPAMLQLKNLPEGAETDDENRESMSVLTQVAKEASAVASAAAEKATEAREKTEFAKAVIEGGAEWVFDGGSVTDEVDIEFVIDSQMSDSSENAIKNKVAKAYVDKEVKKLNASLTELQEKMQTAKLEAHPVGSYYWSSELTEPSELFGGTWERVKDKFILAAGDSYTVGQTGGEAEHKLTVDEMPSHAHCEYGDFGDAEVVPLVSDKGGGAEITGAYFPEETRQPCTSEHIQTTLAGGDKAHNNMPPYEVAYCWKRTA